MRYVYNPTNAPQIVGRVTVPPRNYTVVDEEMAQIIIQSGTPLRVEGQPDFEPCWVEYNTGRQSAKV
jgi:hypothetical protein